MRKLFLLSLALVFSLAACGKKTKTNVNDTEMTKDSLYSIESGKIIPADAYGSGEKTLYVTLVGHGSLMFETEGKVIHVDPYSAIADYSKLPKADLIILTHEHADHLDKNAIAAIRKPSTHFIVSKICNEMLGYGDVMLNGDTTTWMGIGIKAIPAYNMVNKKPDGQAYHPQGRGNGYIFTFADKKVYVAGDTENIPEMEQLKGQIDIAFMPKNLPYTMTDAMFIDAARKVQPKVLYPYHFSEFDEAGIAKALEGTGIELKVRPMKNN